MLDASGPLAVLASFLWGLCSVVLSPCHLAGVPLLVGHIAESSGRSRAKPGVLALLFSLGILLTLVLIGVVTAMMGRLLGDTGKLGTTVVGGLVAVFGLSLAGLLPLPTLRIATAATWLRSAHLRSLLLGLIFGLALGPCSFAFLAPLIAVGLQVAGSQPLYTAALFGAYAIGHTSVIFAAGILSGVVGAYLRWNERTRASGRIRAVLGALVVLGGVYVALSPWIR